MSREDARSFVERVANDAEFRRLVSPAAETRDAERVIAIGAQHNLRFTASELDEAANEQRFGAGTRELSDSQLEGVAGGWAGWVSSVLMQPSIEEAGGVARKAGSQQFEY